MNDITIRIAGANGDGIDSSGDLIAKVFLNVGLNVFAYRSYQSIIRGGHVWHQVRISQNELHGPGEKINILVALNQDSIDFQSAHMVEGGSVIYDGSKSNVDALKDRGLNLVNLPMLDIVLKNGGDPLLKNVVAIGAIMKMTGIDIGVFSDIIKSKFGKKGEMIVNNNINSAKAGYDDPAVKNIMELKGDGKKRYMMDGNTALSIGAFASGCRFYAAYPMTPASGILHWFAAHQKLGVVVKQTEDEIAAINMTIGAASAGARSMCGTSGGGFSLMVEALGLSGMLEVPIVVVDSQRGGPSTGLPTKTEQGDLLFVSHASQGEFPRIVVSPRNIKESLYVGAEAHNLAEKYQCPVIILMDLYISEHAESINTFELEGIKVDRGKIATKSDGRFKRYEITTDGISPRSFPGTPGLEFIAPSDEHDEYGNLVTDFNAGIDKYVGIRRQMHEKRMRKIDTMLKEEKGVFVPDVSNADAEYFFVTFGSTTESVMEAVELLSPSGKKFGIISFKYLMPLDVEKTKALLSGKKLIDVEYNFTAQLAYLIKANTCIDISHRILKYDGEAFTGREIADKALELVSKW